MSNFESGLKNFDFLKREEVINFWTEEFLEGQKDFKEFLGHSFNQLRCPFYRFREVSKRRVTELFKLAYDFLEDEDYKSARTYFNLGVSYDHKNVLFWKGKAGVCMKLGFYQEAINSYDRAYEISKEASTLLRREIAKLALTMEKSKVSSI